jgi:hypothetical protein
MRKNRRRAVAALIGLALPRSQASATAVSPGPARISSAALVEPAGFGPCGPPAVAPCPSFVPPYPVYQGQVLPYPGYRVYVAPYPVNPCAVHVWDLPYPCRRPEPILAPPCSPCGGS